MEELKEYMIYDRSGQILHKGKAKNYIAFVEEKKANLSNADLYKADLSNADLSNANLSNAYLYKADLSNADLSNANLSNAYLYRADLSNANLYRADLYRADLYKADLSNADLSNANLSNANLYRADLSNANLSIFSKWNLTWFIEKSSLKNIKAKDCFIKIGCKTKSIKDWDKWFNGTEEFETKRDTEEFKMIYANYRAMREYLKIRFK